MCDPSNRWSAPKNPCPGVNTGSHQRSKGNENRNQDAGGDRFCRGHDGGSRGGHVADRVGSRSGRPGMRGLRGAASQRSRVGGRHVAGPGRDRGVEQPELTTLTAAVSGQLNPQVNLVDTLNNGQYTVFAPTDDAFNKLPSSTIDQLKTNADLLKSILTYHVVQGQLSPAKIPGTHKTLQGGNVTVTGQGNNLRINNAGLVCGGVPTANATVYMIDTVLMPPGM
ncbi:immunogenic protein MPB70 [Mycobacterium xenopi 4042]|uniref:Immunogenic protein MPB70 n=1 Tax=Mycobacterium xenopi 4042 TaxID=1299334 RepID=X8EYU6_MYCXE|nr:immunogenic protein MPB70 [Mycobacterium xenopi 4042]